MKKCRFGPGCKSLALCPPGVRTVLIYVGVQDSHTWMEIHPVIALQAMLDLDEFSGEEFVPHVRYLIPSPDPVNLYNTQCELDWANLIETGKHSRCLAVACPWPFEEDEQRLKPFFLLCWKSLLQDAPRSSMTAEEDQAIQEEIKRLR